MKFITGLSSCEMLTAELKDSKRAIIFGEALTTGGGVSVGPSLMEFHQATLPKSPLKLLPYVSPEYNTSSVQDIRFSVAQTARHDGRPLENYGVNVDHVILPTTDDVFVTTHNPAAKNSQFDKIIDILQESR